MPPTLVLPGIDTINVSDVDIIRLGHGYIANARSVLIEMHTLITRGVPPNERFGLHEARNEENKAYLDAIERARRSVRRIRFPDRQGVIRGMAKEFCRCSR
jgi:hypothetical protein